MMTTNQKVLAAALTTALLGGTVGAFIARSPKANDTAPDAVIAKTETPAQPTANDLNANPAINDATVNDAATNQRLAVSNPTNEPVQANSYRNGFDDGYQAAHEQKGRTNVASESVQSRRVETRTRYVDSSPRRYAYTETRRPSFVQRHRDLLTVAGSAGGGALIGGLIGGKRGAGIGALAGGAGGALYTYKLRRRPNRY